MDVGAAGGSSRTPRRFRVGTVAAALRPRAAGGFVVALENGFALADDISNGLQWSADGSRVFYNDTDTSRVDVFDYDGDTGAFSNRRPFATIEPGVGAADGMAIDAEDGIWIALWGGGAVRRYDAQGRLTDVVSLPVSLVTACAFGGPELRTLFITTSRVDLGPGEQPEARSVFRHDTAVRGATPYAFAG